MDREEVIKWLMIMKANLNSFPEVSKAKKIEALEEAIRFLKNEGPEEPSSSEKPNKSENPTNSTTENDLGIDAVSRKELLKIYEYRFFELQKMKHLKDNKGAEDRQMGVNYCINILKELPSVTPILEQEPRWIPVSERLPERSGEYLVSVIDGSGDDIDYEAVRVAWLAHKKDYDIKESEWRELGIDEIVIAWMPLPKPYSEVEE